MPTTLLLLKQAMHIGFLTVYLFFGNAAAPAPEARARSHELYVRSGDLGVDRCTFPVSSSALNLSMSLQCPLAMRSLHACDAVPELVHSKAYRS